MIARALIVILTLAAATSAQAIEFRIRGQALRLDITETLFAAYHGDLGALVVEHDRNGQPIVGAKFYDILNKLNVALTWKSLRLATRFDTAVFFDTPAGSCGPELTTQISLRSRFCQKYFYLEKISLEYTSRRFEATLGDFYVSFGRGLVLSIRKLDELGIDTTLQGGRFVYHDKNVALTLVSGIPAVIWGGANIQNVDEATGRVAPDPHDFIAGGRIEYRILDRVIAGVHAAGGYQNTNLTTGPHRLRDGYLMYGGSVEAPRVGRWLALYAEGAGQLAIVSDKLQQGYALYGSATGYFGPTTVLLEFKHYSRYQRWRSSVDGALVEFAPIVYNLPPTAERLQTELVSPIYDVTGPRLRADWRVKPWLLLYASYAFFQDRGNGGGTLLYHDPYAGGEVRWSEQGRSHLFASGGFRVEQCGRDATDCLATTPTRDLFQTIGHVEWDVTQALPHGLSLEAQGFALFRRGDKVTTSDAAGNLSYPRWTEGDAYFALKWSPHLSGTFGYEWSTRPSPRVNEHFFNGTIQWNITTASSLRFFVGGTRGGLKCISGICRDFPSFTGARLEVVVRL